MSAEYVDSQPRFYGNWREKYGSLAEYVRAIADTKSPWIPGAEAELIREIATALEKAEKPEETPASESQKVDIWSLEMSEQRELIRDLQQQCWNASDNAYDEKLRQEAPLFGMTEDEARDLLDLEATGMWAQKAER
ncbi:hypothetical protein SEA_RASPUTIA_19 [Microbacterium phage Rasputia]|nr:hypothetical protein SEA_RASPUTIA_19 [Microbacterium phage Rasputia]